MNFLSLLLLAASLVATLQARPALEKPNLVVIFLDDCGYGDFSHTGNPSIHTPHVSRLVAEGANFTQFYAASPACSASRYALLTGRNPGRSGLGTWVLGPKFKRHLHRDEFTLAEGLKQQGYATGIFGKWHLGEPNEANGFSADAYPLAHGFDVWEGTNVSNDYIPGTNLICSKPQGNTPIPGYEVLARNICENLPIHENLTQRYRERAVDFIATHKESPFFLYLAPNMPHLPVHASDAFKGSSRRGLYGDCIEEIDAMIGSIRASLEQHGIARNTLLIVSSDNGPWILYGETQADKRYGEARLGVGSALPFRDGKGSTWEGGVRVAGVWYWPGTINPATVIQDAAGTLDVMPTALALAGAKLPDDRIIDGRDLRPLLNPALFAGSVPDFTHIYTGAGDNRVLAARHGPWKIHIELFSQLRTTHGFQASRQKPLLFQIEEDFGERFDRAAEQPAVVNQLLGLIDAYHASLEKDPPFWMRK